MLHKVIWQILNALMFSGTLGFFGIGEGPSPFEQKELGAETGIANFATSEGEGDIGASDTFWKSILSGDPSKISKVLGPEMSTINKQGQQEKKTLSEFGNRGGGTNAKAQTIDDSSRSSIDSLIASFTGKAADSLGAQGGSLLNLGSSATGASFDMSKVLHDQNLAKWNDLFKSIAQTASAFGGPVGDLGTALS